VSRSFRGHVYQILVIEYTRTISSVIFCQTRLGAEPLNFCVAQLGKQERHLHVGFAKQYYHEYAPLRLIQDHLRTDLSTTWHLNTGQNSGLSLAESLHLHQYNMQSISQKCLPGSRRSRVINATWRYLPYTVAWITADGSSTSC
jgi:hypothetical protein